MLGEIFDKDVQKLEWKYVLLHSYTQSYPGSENSLLSGWSDYDYSSQPLVMLTSFLGLPNTQRLSHKLTVRDVLKNMAGLSIENEKKGHYSKLDKAFAVPTFIFNIVRMFLTTLLFSIPQIFTEFLPGIGEEACRLTKKGIDSKKHPVLNFLLGVGQNFYSALHFVGRAITSPVKGYAANRTGWGRASIALSIIAYGVAGVFAIGLFATPLLGCAILAAIFHPATDGLLKKILPISNSKKPPTIEYAQQPNNNSTKQICAKIPVNVAQYHNLNVPKTLVAVHPTAEPKKVANYSNVPSTTNEHATKRRLI